MPEDPIDIKKKGRELLDAIATNSGIEAGLGINAGWGIEAGDDFGIFAGIKAKIEDWKLRALVIARSKPKNLISGYFNDHGS